MIIMEKLYQKLKTRIKGDNRTILMNILGMVVCKGISILFTLILFPTYIEFFGNNNVLGMWFTILSVLNWILVFDLGIGNGLRNKLPNLLGNKDYSTAKTYISSTYVISIIFSFTVYLCFLLLKDILDWNSILGVSTDIISYSSLTRCIHIIIIGILFQFILKNIASICYALQRPVVINVMGLISNVIILIFLLHLNIDSIEEKLIAVAIINVIAVNLPMLCYTVYVFTHDLRKCIPALCCFEKTAGKNLLQVGLTILWLQIIFLVVSSTNEFFITWLTDASNVVEYQAYYKVYSLGAVIFSFALTPIWSAVTKAQCEKNFKWIKKVYKFFLLACVLCLVIELGITFFVQYIFDIWLGTGVIQFRFWYGFVFAIHSTVFILHSINTSISNGLSYFRFQAIGMTIAAIIDFPLAVLFVNWTGSWVGVLMASPVAMMFYELLAPHFTMKHIDSIS